MKGSNNVSVAKVSSKKFSYFIGIDVSKNKLDYAVIFNKELLFHKVAENEPEEIINFVEKLKDLPRFTLSKAVFCMENTGIYCNHLLYSLKKLKANIVLENALQIKNSFGLIRGKYDKIDAIRIAKYIQKNWGEMKLWEARRPVVLQLMAFSTLRTRMLNLSLALNAPLKEQAVFFDKELKNQSLKYCLNSAVALKADLKNIDEFIGQLINSDPYIKRLKQLITSVPGVGHLTAVQIIICTNEYRDIKDPKKFACYAGVAPFKRDSGVSTTKARVSKIANKKIKTLLHICAVNAVRHDPEIKGYFERKTKIEGKPRMAVYNAVRNKLILRIFACLSQDRCYVKAYINRNNLISDAPNYQCNYS